MKPYPTLRVTRRRDTDYPNRCDMTLTKDHLECRVEGYRTVAGRKCSQAARLVWARGNGVYDMTELKGRFKKTHMAYPGHRYIRVGGEEQQLI